MRQCLSSVSIAQTIGIKVKKKTKKNIVKNEKKNYEIILNYPTISSKKFSLKKIKKGIDY